MKKTEHLRNQGSLAPIIKKMPNFDKWQSGGRGLEDVIVEESERRMTEEVDSATSEKLKDVTYQGLTQDEPFEIIDHNDFVQKLILNTEKIEERFLKIKAE